MQSPVASSPNGVAVFFYIQNTYKPAAQHETSVIALCTDSAQGRQSRCNFWDTGASLGSGLSLLALFSDGMHVAVRPMTFCDGPASNKTCASHLPTSLLFISKDMTAQHAFLVQDAVLHSNLDVSRNALHNCTHTGLLHPTFVLSLAA